MRMKMLHAGPRLLFSVGTDKRWLFKWEKQYARIRERRSGYAFIFAHSLVHLIPLVVRYQLPNGYTTVTEIEPSLFPARSYTRSLQLVLLSSN